MNKLPEALKEEMEDMTLLTPEMIEEFKKKPLRGFPKSYLEDRVITVYYTPLSTGTWIITRGRKLPDGDYLMFGYCHIFEWEWGYIRWSELVEVHYSCAFVMQIVGCEGSKVKDFLKEGALWRW